MKAITECPQAFIITPSITPMIGGPIKGIIVDMLTKVFSPALEISLIPKALFISANVLPGIDIKAFTLAS
ncbi:MAG: hypothetical protein V7K31_13875 [Nostoc sp.]